MSQAVSQNYSPRAVQALALARQHLPDRTQGPARNALSRECWSPVWSCPTLRMKGLKLREGRILYQSHATRKARDGLGLATHFPKV